jgi:two-component system response regulator FixJ
MIQEALTEAARFREKQVRLKILMDKLALLTQSERDILDFVMAGVANKVIARELGLCQRMVEVHRASIMAKMQVDSLAELVTLVNQADNVEQGRRTLNTLSRKDLQ